MKAIKKKYRLVADFYNMSKKLPSEERSVYSVTETVKASSEHEARRMVLSQLMGHGYQVIRIQCVGEF